MGEIGGSPLQWLNGPVRRLARLHRYGKRTLLALSDVVALGLAVWLAMSLRLGQLYNPPTLELAGLMAAAPIVGVATFAWRGIYRLSTRFIDERGFAMIAGAVLISSLIWAVLVMLSGVQPAYTYAAGNDTLVRVVPRSVLLIYPLLSIVLVCGVRQLATTMFAAEGPRTIPGRAKNVLIWGAGRFGVQLAEALQTSGEAEPIGFIDSNVSLWDQYVHGIKVFRPEMTRTLVERWQVSEVLLAIPQPQRREREAALHVLKPIKVGVRMLHALEDLAAGRSVASALRAVQVDDVMWRPPLPIDSTLLASDIAGKSIMVAGAGGAIGSELARQALRLGPKRLVLFDSSEAKLYEIAQEVEAMLAPQSPGGRPRTAKVEVAVVLGSITDYRTVEAAIRHNSVDGIYHAAAFKCLDLIERNPAAGIRNNVFGTSVLAEAAVAERVARFTMASSLIADHPFSVAAASMRLAEMVLQARGAQHQTCTTFSAVRFGALLDGPGSLLERWQTEITAGGPVGVGAPGAQGRFMLRTEAAQLIIQAGAAANSGEIFIVPNGEAVSLEELARSTIRLMGRIVRDDQRPDGDIAIAYALRASGAQQLWEMSAPAEAGVLLPREAACALERMAEVLGSLRAADTAGDEQRMRAVLDEAVRAGQVSFAARR